MGSNVTVHFAFCGHELQKPSQTQGGGSASEPMNVTAECCCSKKCCVTAILPYKDAQEKASFEMCKWRMETGPGLVTGESLLDVSEQTRKEVDNAHKEEMTAEMTALNAERARHETCDVLRQKAMAED